MATVLKSNSSAKKFITSALEMSLPSDYKASLNFVTEKYKLNQVASSIPEILSVTRGFAAGYIDGNGNYATAAVNVPRIHNDADAGKGLLIESAVTNLLSNGATPATQTITATLSVVSWFVVQVFGSGSCNVEIKNSSGVLVQSGVSTEANPFMYKATTTITGASITVTPTGISHFQAYVNALPRTKQTKLTTGTIPADIILFNKALLADFLSTRNELTVVVKKSELKDRADATLSNPQSGTIMQILQEADTKGLYVARQKGGSNKNGVLRTNLTTETLVQNKLSETNEVFALAFSSNSARMFQNGQIVELPISEALTLTRLYIGGGLTWSVSYEQLIKELYVYDRKLTDAELLTILF